MVKLAGQENVVPGNLRACADFHLNIEEDDLPQAIEAAGPWIVCS
jgi:hypothetical protein